MVFTTRGSIKPSHGMFCNALRMEFDVGEFGLRGSDGGVSTVGGSRNQCNAKIIEDMSETGVRVEMGMDGIVKREEIKRCLEVVMGDSNTGEEIRKKALKWKELAKEAARDGGSSDANFKAFVDQVCS